MNDSSQTDRNIQNVVDKIQQTLALSHDEFRALFDFSKQDYLRYRKQIAKAPLSNFYNLISHLRLDMTNFLQANIDYQTLYEHFYGNPYHLPTKYQEFANSKMRTIKNALDFSILWFGENFKDEILRQSQISELALNNLDCPVNAQLINTIFTKLQENGLNPQHFQAIGKSSASLFQQSSLGKEVSSISSHQKAYEFLLENTHLVEKNMHYRILKSTSSLILFEHKTHEATQDYFKTEHFGTDAFCYNIQGFVSAFYKYLTPHEASVNKLSCVHQGDPSCRYQIEFAS